MKSIDTVVFVETERGDPDRGWPEHDARQELERSGVPCDVVRAHTPDDLALAAAPLDSALFWPLGHTFGTSPSSPGVFGALADLGLPYIGPTAAGARLTSKLRFKEALKSVELPTPWHSTVGSADPPWAAGLTLPIFVKTEFSCDSEGVRLAHDEQGLRESIEDLIQSFHETVFLEERAGTHEWTIGCVVIEDGCLHASLGLRPKFADFIDVETKSHNELLEIFLPDQALAVRLGTYVEQLARRLSLRGYFRVDVLTSPDGPILPIDMNILPFLNAAEDHMSYLPMAFIRTFGCTYGDVLAAVVASANMDGARWAPGSTLESFVRSSVLLVDREVSAG